MKRPAATVLEAARELRVTASTVRGWIRRGAPTIELGSVGRGRGSRVDVAALRAWRSGVSTSSTVDLDRIATGMWAAYSRAPEGESRPTWQTLGVDRDRAAAMLVATYYEIARSVTGRYPEQLPAEIERLFAISQDSVRRGSPPPGPESKR
jgi:hypothetical protein